MSDKRRYVVRRVITQHVDYEIYALDDKTAKNLVELGHMGECIAQNKCVDKYSVLTPDEEPEV